MEAEPASVAARFRGPGGVPRQGRQEGGARAHGPDQVAVVIAFVALGLVGPAGRFEGGIPRVTLPGGPSAVLAHQGGWDEFGLVLVPLLVFLTLQWLNRRKLRKQEGEEPETNSP